MPERRPRSGRLWLERVLLLLIVLAVAAVVAGGVFAQFDAVPPLGASSAVGLGVLMAAAAMLMGHNTDVLRAALRPVGGTRYEQLRRWTRVKVASLLLYMLLVVAAFVLFVAVGARLGFLPSPPPDTVQLQFLAAFNIALAAALTYAHYQSLRVSLERDRAGMQSAYHGIGVAVAATLALVGAMTPTLHANVGPLRAGDGAFLHLAALAVLGASLYPSRGLPTPYAIFTHDPRGYHGATHYSRRKSILLPVMVAFGLLFVLLLLFMVFGIGVVRVVDELLQSTLVLGLLGLLVLAMVASFVASLYLARQDDSPVMYRPPRTREQRQEAWILGVSLLAAAALGVLAFMVARGAAVAGLQPHHWVDVAGVALLVALGPPGFYKAHQARRVRRMEARFPDFLRDLASSHKGGLTLSSAVHVASKGDYGELTPEVVKMADQISWNVAFDEALQRFGQRVHTPVVQRTVNLILEASRSGGSTVDVLEAAGRDAREIKNLEDQRRLSMGLYISVIYVTFLVFLVVVAVLYANFVPQIVAASEAGGPDGATGLETFGLRSPTLEQFRTLYYVAAVVQGLGDGLVAGLMAAGRLSNGLRHAFLMVLIAFVTFTFFL